MPYDREAAVAYAHRWAYFHNPEFYNFDALGGDCTNFASQCIFAGYPQMNFSGTNGWFYVSLNNRSPSWTGVNELYRFLTENTSGIGPRAVDTDISQIRAGDIIQLRLSGQSLFGHTPVVVDSGENTPSTIQIAAHSYDCDCRPLSSYNYSDIRYLHII